MTLETVMVEVFGIRTPSAVQLAVWRLIEGRPLADLAEHPDVIAAIGNVAGLPVGIRPREVDVIAPIRSAKSMTAAGAAFVATQTVDVSKLAAGEVPRVSIVSLTRDLGSVVFRLLVGQIEAHRHLRALLIGEPKEDRIVLRHPSGKPVEVCVVAASRAGGSLVARWSAGVVFDEAPRMLGELDGALVNIDDMIAAVEGRMLPGAQILAIGSPWAPVGPMYDRVQALGGQPSRDLVVVRGTGPQWNPQWWTPERCADLARKNPRAFRTDVLAEFANGEGAAFDADQVEATKRPIDWSRYESAGPVIVCDPSSGRGDAFTYGAAEWLVPLDNAYRPAMYRDPMTGAEAVLRDAKGEIIYEPPHDLSAVLYLHSIFGVTGRFEGTVTAEEIAKQIATLARRVGAHRVVADQRESLALSSLLAAQRVAHVAIPWTAQSKPLGIESVRRWLADRQLVIESSAAGDRVRRQLIGYRARFNAAGTLTFGGRGDGDDYAALAITAALGDAEGIIRGGPARRSHRRIEGGSAVQ